MGRRNQPAFGRSPAPCLSHTPPLTAGCSGSREPDGPSAQPRRPEPLTARGREEKGRCPGAPHPHREERERNGGKETESSWERGFRWALPPRRAAGSGRCHHLRSGKGIGAALPRCPACALPAPSPSAGRAAGRNNGAAPEEGGRGKRGPPRSPLFYPGAGQSSPPQPSPVPPRGRRRAEGRSGRGRSPGTVLLRPIPTAALLAPVGSDPPARLPLP